MNAEPWWCRAPLRLGCPLRLRRASPWGIQGGPWVSVSRLAASLVLSLGPSDRPLRVGRQRARASELRAQAPSLTAPLSAPGRMLLRQQASGARRALAAPLRACAGVRWRFWCSMRTRRFHADWRGAGVGQRRVAWTRRRPSSVRRSRQDDVVGGSRELPPEGGRPAPPLSSAPRRVISFPLLLGSLLPACRPQ